MPIFTRETFLSVIFLTFITLLSSCASVSRGVTEAILEDKHPGEKDMGACEVDSRPLTGLYGLLYGEKGSRQESGTLNLLMIHGIGDTYPDYSVRFQRRLTKELGLTRVTKKQKKITILAKQDSSPRGELRVTRYLDASGKFQLLFHELTWSVITRPYKEILNQDLNNREAQLRAGANQALKAFVDDHLVDPTLYQGIEHEAILESASQGMCWMLHNDWETLPDEMSGRCKRALSKDILSNFKRHPNQKFAIITHSLGSQIVLDMLDRDLTAKKKWIKDVYEGHDIDSLNKVFSLLNKETLHVYMFANQLMLLQLGTQPPAHTGKIDRFCNAGAEDYDERLLKKLSIIAFSDPNDLLSYSIPVDFADSFIDSRLCPEITNIYVNVAPVINLLGLGKITSPMAAHNNYESDPRVIGLITHGIGNDQVSPAVSEGCQWMETVTD